MIQSLFQKTLLAQDHSKSLLRHFQDHGLDWMHACGGKGRCTTCKIIVTDGESNFNEPTPAEKRYAREGSLKVHERLACQAKISGDVSLLVPREYQLPHVHYSNEL